MATKGERNNDQSMLKTRRTTTLGQVTRSRNKIMQLPLNDGNIHLVKTKVKAYMEKTQDISEGNDAYVAALEQENQLEECQMYEERQSSTSLIMCKVRQSEFETNYKMNSQGHHQGHQDQPRSLADHTNQSREEGSTTASGTAA